MLDREKLQISILVDRYVLEYLTNAGGKINYYSQGCYFMWKARRVLMLRTGGKVG